MYQYIDVHTHKTASENIFEIINSKNIEEKGYFSVGIHPWRIGTSEPDYSKIYELANKPNILAIGEIGIDRSINTNIELQKQVFLKQLQLAKEINLPVIIHCVRAYSDFQQIINSYPYTYIFHGFNANLTIANYFISNGGYLSFGKQLLTNKKLQNAFKELSVYNIFFETDENDISIKDIYIFAAKLLNISLSELQEMIQSNFKKVFGIDVRKLAK